MNRPKRIQRKRTKGWRTPEGAVYVGRPGPWGNPYRVAGKDYAARARAVDQYQGWINGEHCRYPATPEQRHWVLDMIHELRGKDLVCWCPLDQPCHADILLEMANKEKE